jgi:cell division septum initiation protein DivIVA
MTNDLDGLVAEVLSQYQGPEHAALRALITQLVALNESLAARVAELEAELKRHSGNSSKPPSADTLAQRQAQKDRRQAWTKKGAKKRRPGKQPGAPGAHLAQVEHPDDVVLHAPQICRECGSPLTEAEVVSTETARSSTCPSPPSSSPSTWRSGGAVPADA